MTIYIDETWYEEELEIGTSVEDDSADVPYILRTDNEETRQDVLDWVTDDDNLPHDFLGMRIRSLNLRRLTMENRWLVTASYESSSSSWTLQKLEVGDVRWEINGNSGATARQAFSSALESEDLGTGQTEPALTGTAGETVIGLVHRDGDFEVEGIDVPTGGSQVLVNTVFDHATMVTDGHALALLNYQDNHVINSDAWKIFPAGTLQLDVVTLKPRSGNEPDWDVTLNFIYSQNLTSIDVGNGITVASKKGHQLLDVLFMKKQIAGLPLSVPVRAAVHDLNPEVSFGSGGLKL